MIFREVKSFEDIEFFAPAEVEAELIDPLGRQVYTERFTAPAGEVVRDMDANRLSSGIYMLNMRMEGRTFQRRVVVERSGDTITLLKAR